LSYAAHPGDVAVELGIERLVDDTHAALTNLLEYFVVRYGLTDHRLTPERERAISNF
jgi:hypothetical protein